MNAVQWKLEQLERQKFKFWNFARNFTYETHFLKLLNKMYQYEIDPTRTVGATERTWDTRRTDADWRTDRRSEIKIPHEHCVPLTLHLLLIVAQLFSFNLLLMLCGMCPYMYLVMGFSLCRDWACNTSQLKTLHPQQLRCMKISWSKFQQSRINFNLKPFYISTHFPFSELEKWSFHFQLLGLNFYLDMQ